MPKKWRFLPHDPAQIQFLCGQLRVSPLLAQVLLARGFTCHEAAGSFLNARLSELHDPELLPGIPDAADRMVSAVKAGRRITIYGDYDVDGVTATSLLWHCLKLSGANVDYYIPSRMQEGYGLNCEAIRKLHEEDPGRLLVSVDCGICSVEEAALAKTLGLELIITDHHQPGANYPEADCLVHPRLPGGDYPFGELCGAGVAFKLAWAICARLGDGKKASPQMREFLKGAVGLAAIGTVADVVPLRGENRILVRYGLASLLERSTPGLKALMKVAGLELNRELQAEDIGFAIAPRINAAGRLGQARLAVELLTTEAPDRADALAKYLDELNQNRRTVERRMLRQAKELVEENPAWETQPALVLARREWHQGVLGIVASRVAEHYQKPAILIALGNDGEAAQGSGRSFCNCDLHGALSACAEHLATFGGHRVAAGVRIEPGRIDAFREQFCDWVGRNHSVSDRDLDLQIDAEVRLADVNRRAVLELDRLGPFGSENLRPTFVATRVDLAEPPRKIGEGERHLSLRVRRYGSVSDAVAFGRGEWADEIAKVKGTIAIGFAPGINRFRGRESVELQLSDWQPENNAAPAELKPATGAV